MSRQIDQEKIDSGDLDDDEILYLQDRGLLPDHIEPLELRYYEGPAWARTGYVEPEAESTEESGDDDEDEDEDYGEGWNNERRRSELSSRGLSVDGTKETLIDRLLRSDSGDLTDEDKA